MESLLSMEFLLSPDSIICMISGAVIGVLAAQFIKGWGFGLIGNLVAGLIGGLLGGAAFNTLDIIDLGDYADPIIAGIVGAAIVIAIGGAIWRAIKS
jgi:uncharacterized membrane protein YeaQ/YmgE (transglycosylase-associated protein family)